MGTSTAVHLDAIEAVIADLLPQMTAARAGPGRPEVLPGAVLWAGVLVGCLRGHASQQAVWRLISQCGLWDFPRVAVSAEGVRIRLQRAGPAMMQHLFDHVTATLIDQSAGDQTLAPFARGVYALDESVLDQVARTLPPLRALPAGAAQLLPGKLSTVFDVRRQLFHTVLPHALPRQNGRVLAPDLVATVPPGSLLLADLGYFGFAWFDGLTDAGYHYLSKLRAGTSYTVVHVLTDQAGVRDELVWLGAYRADQAKHLVRLITLQLGSKTYRYLTNVTDPALLPVAEVVRLYARRWDIELAFKLIKRELGLHLLWSARWELILTQVWAALVIFQITASLRAQIAVRAKIDLFDISLALLLRDLPRLAQRQGTTLIDALAALPVVNGGYLRPSRRLRHQVPAVLPITPPPTDLARTRPPRYAGRKCGPNRTDWTRP